MALRAGYYGIKKKILSQLLGIPDEVDDLTESVQGKADADLLAPTQATLTADKAYVVGEQFIYENKLYKVTQDIAKDATITIGTNAVLAGSITGQQLEVYPIDGAGTNTRVISNSDVSNPFALPMKSFVRVYAAQNEEIVLGIVLKDKSDYMKAIHISGTHPEMTLGITLEAGTLLVKKGTGTNCTASYTPFEV